MNIMRGEWQIIKKKSSATSKSEKYNSKYKSSNIWNRSILLKGLYLNGKWNIAVEKISFSDDIAIKSN